MPQNLNASVIWENNPDTSLSSDNLSKSLNYATESKFIYKVTDSSEYQNWADAIKTTEPVGSEIAPFVGKIVYIINDSAFIRGMSEPLPGGGMNYYWDRDIPSPVDKMLKILPNSRIGLSYVNTQGETKYLNFDSGNLQTLFSINALVNMTDFLANTVYNIYIYNSVNLGDFASIYIVSQFDDDNNTGDWKTGENDSSSPTGKKIIALKKIGGFTTDSTGYIIENSVWDISIYNKENVSEKYKIYDSTGVRDYTSKDIPITNDDNLFVVDNVEDALSDVKNDTLGFNEDIYYTQSRFGCELKYSQFKLDEFDQKEFIQPNGISLKITGGFMNVAGYRVKIDGDIYLDNSETQEINSNGVKISINGESPVNNIRLGAKGSNTNIYPGIWRVFIDRFGQILFRENTFARPIYLNERTMKGWYYRDFQERCIGKFRVRVSGGQYYIEKLSVTNTVDDQVTPGSVMIFHGTMCPDGLLPCDGKWHDVLGSDPTGHADMPPVESWTNSWYEETPNMWGRTVKMYDDQQSGNSYIDQKRFQITPILGGNDNSIVIGYDVSQGGAEEITAPGGHDAHNHNMNHTHAPGTLSIGNSGTHIHNNIEFSFTGTDGNSPNVLVVADSPDATQKVNVASITHEHILSITNGGGHGHPSSSFDGQTANASPSTTSDESTWPPYNEFMFCIKK